MDYGNTSQNYEKLDIQTLTNLLTNPDNLPEVHRGAFTALLKIEPDERRKRVAVVVKSMLQEPSRYDSSLIVEAIEILATDPYPDATEAMLNFLPDMLALGIKNRDAISQDVREYYYQALVTRTREDDLVVWSEMLPRLDGKTLVASMLEPAAKALETIEPMTLIDRLSEPDRTRALVSVMRGMAFRGKRDLIKQAAEMLVRTNHGAEFKRGIDLLADQWGKAKKAGRDKVAQNLELGLSIIDNEPRSAVDRLTGKRPWAG
ncbi:MAG: hypothetical protein JXJ17_01940 [Anaerolineae bacterium]|nr:hypothetical protein [Anaerolineae bacterium]